MNRRVLLETLANELPIGTIRYSSKVVHIQSEDHAKSIHLSDGTVLETKVVDAQARTLARDLKNFHVI